MRQTETILRVIIADHELEVRQALRLLCEERPGLIVIAESADGIELLPQLEVTQADILLLEWELPGIEPETILQRRKEDLHTIVLSSQPEKRVQALNVGAYGFVYKGDAPDELINLLQTLIEKG